MGYVGRLNWLDISSRNVSMVWRSKEGRRGNPSQELEEGYPSDWKVLSSRNQVLEGKKKTTPILLGFLNSSWGL